MLSELFGGGDAGWAKVSDLLRNTRVLSKSSLVFQGVGHGEYPLGISLEYAGNLWAKNGAPVKVIYQSDRKSVVRGKSVSVRVDLGGRRRIQRQNINTQYS